MEREKKDQIQVINYRKHGDWTVLVFLAGDNNLNEECLYALTEMKQVNFDGKIKVLAQFDPRGVSIPTKRYYINNPRFHTRRSNAPSYNDLQEDEVMVLEGEANMGCPETLLRFILWGIRTYPADHYMIVLCGHGNGTDDDYLMKDENPPDALSVPELRWVFDSIKDEFPDLTIDILGFDACMMSMAEVLYELRGSIDYIVGSEGYGRNAGWPYRDILSELNHETDMPPEKLARIIVEKYIKFYKNYVYAGVSVDQSALKVKEFENIKNAVRRLVQVIKPRLSNDNFKKALILAHWETQSYGGEVFVDISDFCKRLRYFYDESLVQIACRNVESAVRRCCLKSCTSGAAFQYSYGISMYFPWNYVAPHYRNIDFSKDSEWLSFLQQYVIKTRRRPRTKDIVRADKAGVRDRSTPPDSKGPDGRVYSMRNPPDIFISRNCEAEGCMPEKQASKKPARGKKSPAKNA